MKFLIQRSIILAEVVLILTTALFCVITQQFVVISYLSFGTIHWYHQRVQESKAIWILELKMGLIGRPETLVRNHNYLLRNNPEERSSQLLHSRNLKSCTVLNLLIPST